jgi:hypothetical protein
MIRLTGRHIAEQFLKTLLPIDIKHHFDIFKNGSIAKRFGTLVLKGPLSLS